MSKLKGEFVTFELLVNGHLPSNSVKLTTRSLFSSCHLSLLCFFRLWGFSSDLQQSTSRNHLQNQTPSFYTPPSLGLNTKQSNLAISRSCNRICGKPVCGCCIKVADRIPSLEKPEEDTNWSCCHGSRIYIQDHLSEGEVEDFATVIIFCIELESRSSISLNKISTAIRANDSVKLVQMGDHVDLYAGHPLRY